MGLSLAFVLLLLACGTGDQEASLLWASFGHLVHGRQPCVPNRRGPTILPVCVGGGGADPSLGGGGGWRKSPKSGLKARSPFFNLPL